MKIVKRALKWTLSFVGIFVLYVLIVLIYGTITDFQPDEKIALTVQKSSDRLRVDSSELTFINWNIGYANLGKEANFFYDDGGFLTTGGKQVRGAKADVERYLNGIIDFLKTQNVDFVLLQEIDSLAKRSYGVNQLEALQAIFPSYSRTFGVNFNVGFVPLPLLQPWDAIGHVVGGVATYSRYQPTETTRYQLPGEFSWPLRIFNLDRCMLVNRFPTAQHTGKELVIINAHNSAYDSKGVLRAQEMEYMKKYVEAEYAKGNYVIVGSDWNQCPPNFTFNKFRPHNNDSTYYGGNIAADFLPTGWTWAFDTLTPSNRKMVDVYDADSTFVTLIDFYLLSPNVELLEVKTHDLQFAFSDHQPISLRVRLKDWAADTAAVAPVVGSRK